LAHISGFRRQVEVVKREARAPGEVVLRVRWSKPRALGTALVEETLVAVKEGGGWKVLMPGSGDVDYSPAGGTRAVRRKDRAWTAEAVRKHNEATRKDAREVRGHLELLTRQVEEGKFPDVASY